MILPPRVPIRLPDAPAAEDRKGKAGFDALLDESENATRIQLPKVKLETKEEGPREEEEDTSDPASASLILLEITDAEPAGRPRLQKGDNPAPGQRHAQLGNVQAALERMDVRVAVSRMTTAEAATRMVTPMPADPIRDLGEVFELPRFQLLLPCVRFGQGSQQRVVRDRSFNGIRFDTVSQDHLPAIAAIEPDGNGNRCLP